jgi:DNA-binding MarR family transcriptional regulator
MSSPDHQTPQGRTVTALILEVFRLNGSLLTAGDKLVAPFGLTSARWQVLGAIADAPTGETVARLARNMGVYRQGVQRIVNELASEGLVELLDNPHHRRAKLVTLTKIGSDAFASADRVQKPWADALSSGLDVATLEAACETLRGLRKRLEEQRGHATGDRSSAAPGR